MYILTVEQDEADFPWLCFDSENSAWAFLDQLPGHLVEQLEGFRYDFIDIDLFPDYAEVEHNGVRVPISRFIFADAGEREVFLSYIPSPDRQSQGLLEGASRVDAYSIPNEEMEGYIATREWTYRALASLLEEKGYEVDRSFHGSEDGEAVVYRHQGSADWHFLDHMDPAFVEMGQRAKQNRAVLEEWVAQSLEM